MGALKNVKHEKFAHEIINSSSTQADAYKKVYPVTDNVVASNNASRLLDNASIKSRILELMQERESTSPNGIISKLNALISSENEGIAMQAVNTGLKVYGMFDNEKSAINIDSINVVFAEAPKQNDK